jgi:hypothetical protein
MKQKPVWLECFDGGADMKRVLAILACTVSTALVQPASRAQVQSAMPMQELPPASPDLVAAPALQMQAESGFSVQQTPLWAGGSNETVTLAPRLDNAVNNQPVESATQHAAEAISETK